MRRLAMVLLLAVLVAPAADRAEAGQIRHVSPSGHDASAGTAASPWRTLQRAADAAPPGATVLVRSGTYEGFALRRGGAPRRPLVFRGVGRTIPRVRGTSDARSVIEVRDARHVVLDRLHVSGGRGQWAAGIEFRDATDVRVRRSVIRANRGFGLYAADSHRVLFERNLIERNATGVQISRGGRVRIRANRILRNTAMVVNDPQPHNDRGANGVVLFQASGPILIDGNRVEGNRARSIDYGWDGGAFEIYGASRVTIRGNRLRDNQNAVETGTRPGGACRDNVFAGNRVEGNRSGLAAMGLILRCAERMVVRGNTLLDLDRFAIDINAQAGRFGGSVERLSVTGNRIRASHDKAFSIDSPLPASARIERNGIQLVGGAYLGYAAGFGQTRSFERFREWIGEDVGFRSEPRPADH